MKNNIYMSCRFVAIKILPQYRNKHGRGTSYVTDYLDQSFHSCLCRQSRHLWSTAACRVEYVRGRVRECSRLQIIPIKTASISVNFTKIAETLLTFLTDFKN